MRYKEQIIEVENPHFIPPKQWMDDNGHITDYPDYKCKLCGKQIVFLIKNKYEETKEKRK